MPVPGRTDVAPPGPGGCGDYATNVALKLARPAGQPPLRVAEILRRRLAQSDGISDVVVTGPGFLNISLRRGSGDALVREILRLGQRYGHADRPTGKLVRLHAPHEVRAVVVMDAVARILRAQGAVVRTSCVAGPEPAWTDLLGVQVDAHGSPEANAPATAPATTPATAPATTPPDVNVRPVPAPATAVPAPATPATPLHVNTRPTPAPADPTPLGRDASRPLGASPPRPPRPAPYQRRPPGPAGGQPSLPGPLRIRPHPGPHPQRRRPGLPRRARGPEPTRRRQGGRGRTGPDPPPERPRRSPPHPPGRRRTPRPRPPGPAPRHRRRCRASPSRRRPPARCGETLGRPPCPARARRSRRGGAGRWPDPARHRRTRTPLRTESQSRR
ncbi:hypothetical protein RKD25_002798 [Streptomyces sp. SAI-124]